MSKLRLLAVPVALLFAIACGDADGDGLSNSLEKELGTDPDVADTDGDGVSDGDEQELGFDARAADTDGDGLLDGEELEFGTDGTVADTDGDGYDDWSEVLAGSDPASGDSVIYTGGWPFNPQKDTMNNPGLNSGRQVGDMFPRRTGKDQFGDQVDVYDFAHQGAPIMVDIAAEWCGPCREMARWLEGESDAYSQYNNVRRAVNRGEVIWITMIGQDNSGGQATGSTVESWANAYPHPNVPVVVDKQQRVTDWADLQYFPSTMWLDENMEIRAWNPANPSASLAALSAYCSENGLGERQ